MREKLISYIQNISCQFRSQISVKSLEKLFNLFQIGDYGIFSPLFFRVLIYFVQLSSDLEGKHKIKEISPKTRFSPDRRGYEENDNLKEIVLQWEYIEQKFTRNK